MENELKVNKNKELLFNLVLHDDDINYMNEIEDALVSICNLSEKDAFSVMLIAHNNNKSIILSSTEDELIPIQQKFSAINIKTSIEKI